MRQVRNLLQEKGVDIHTVGPEDSVRAALVLMAEHRIGALLVMRDGELLGMISERDYARKTALMDRSSKNTPVRDIMSTPVTTVTPDTSVAQCMQLCTERRIRHLPVLENNQVTGLVSIGDLVKSIIADQSDEIEHLHQYIAG